MGSPRDDELIERLRSIYDAFNRGDFDAVIDFAHPDMVMVRPGELSELSGMEAVRAWMEPDAFESMAVTPLEFEPSGNSVLVRTTAIGRGAGSGIEVEIGSWAVWTFDDERRITRLAVFL